MPQKQTLFTLTVFEELKIDSDDGWVDFGMLRSIGLFPTLEEAKSVVENNKEDIYESIYNYALIEEVEFGLYPKLHKQELYKLEDTTTKKSKKTEGYVYRKTELPEHFPWFSMVVG